LRQAADEAKNVDDYWRYNRLRYNKEDREKFEKVLHDLETNIDSNRPKSKEYLNQLMKIWEEINNKQPTK
jgi:hypothetical protein